MSVTYPLRLFFDCSTAHLSPASRAYLDAHAEVRDEMIASTPYGWFVWAASEEIADDIPVDLADIMRHARGLDADYVLFDADAEVNAALPTFEWSG